MKTRIFSFITLIAVSMFLVGCTTTSSQFNPTQAAATIQVATATGTTIYLQSNPENRPYFIQADAALGALSTSTNLDITQITALLKSFKVDNSPLMSLAIQDVLTLLTAYGVNVDKLSNAAQYADYLVVINALRSGLEQGLAVTAPPVAPSIIPIMP